MKFYSYWEGGVIPPYLRLCVQTWFKFVPDLELILIDQHSSRKWTSDFYDFENFKKLSYPMQSDAVSAAVLAQEGGTFIDLDTIFSSEVAIDFFTKDLGSLKAFGEAPGLHIAVLSTGRPGNPVATTWRAAVASRLADMPSKRPWNYIGNEPLDRILADPRWTRHIKIIDRATSGNILETIFGKAEPDAQEYRSLYFGGNEVSADTAIKANTSGIISLHNSWTPNEILLEQDLDALLEKDYLFSRLIRAILGDSPQYVARNIPAQLQIQTTN